MQTGLLKGQVDGRISGVLYLYSIGPMLLGVHGALPGAIESSWITFRFEKATN